MTNLSYESLLAENRILQNQANQLRYFLSGSRLLAQVVEDVQVGQTVHCHRDQLHEVAAGFLRPVNVCVDIGPGLRPQRLLPCPVHLLVEPYHPYAEKLVTAYPDKPIIRNDGLGYLRGALGKSVDTIFMCDVIEHLSKEDGKQMLDHALRVAREQVVIFTPLGFMPQHYSEIGDIWGNVEHSDLQNHLSGWLPEEFPSAVHVVADEYHRSADGRTFGAFYSIIEAAKSSAPRLVLASEGMQEGFQFEPRDIIIADIMFSESSWKIDTVPKRNLLIVPLQLIAEENMTPPAVLRNAILNFRELEHYLDRFDNVVALGTAAEVVLQRHRNGWK